MSEGNGHPYSWSAIFNGYDPAHMESCGFSVIPRYLGLRQFPRDGIAQAKVTHVWAQDVTVATHIARAALIPTVVRHFTDMLGCVDGVLLARDDAELHVEMARPFLEAGVPIYVDKPVALTTVAVEELLALQKFPGQLFSCSALRYAPELTVTSEQRQALGDIRYVQAVTPKDWSRYAIHVIDPMLNLLGYEPPLQTHSMHDGDAVLLQALHPAGARVQIAALGGAATPIALTIVGSRGNFQYRFDDSFTAFRAALQDFVEGIIARDVRSTPQQLRSAVSWVQAGASA